MKNYPMRRFSPKILVLLLLLSSSPSWSQDVGGRALLSFQETFADRTTTTDFSQSYELRFQKTVTPVLQYRVFLRWEDDLAKTKEENTTTKNSSKVLQPSLDIFYNFQPFELRFGGEYIQTKAKSDPGTTGLLEQKRLTSQFSWRPEDLPSISIQLDRKMNEDKKASVDTVDTNLNTATDYGYKAFKFSHSFIFSQFGDGFLDFTRKSYDNQGRVDYQDNFVNNRLNITASYLVDYRKTLELAQSATSTSIPVERIPRKGLYVNTDNPLDMTLHPMVNTPSLIDRNLNASTGINIGTPGGLSNHNIGVDLGRSQNADQIQIYARNSTGGLVLFGGPISWDVYVSKDGIHWTLIAPSASTVFNPTFSRYEISFPQTDSQYFKIVNFGVNTVEAFVTEMQIFNHDTFVPGEKRTTTDFVQTGNLTTVYKPIDKVTLTYDGFFNIFKNKTGENAALTSTDWNQGLTALLEPFRFLNATLRYQMRKNTSSQGQGQGQGQGQTRGQNQDSNFLSSVFNFLFLKNLDTTLSASQTNEKTNGEKSNSNSSLLLHNSARLYKGWDVGLDLGYTHQKNFTENQVTDTYNVTATSFTQLTKNLTVSFNGTAQRSSLSGQAVQSKTTTTEQVSAEFYYRPSQQINLSARWGYLVGEQQSGLIQRYKLDWMPFPEGAIQFTGTYELGRDQLSSQSQDRYSATIRWNVNRTTYLDVNYTRAVTKATETSTIQTFVSTFSITF